MAAVIGCVFSGLIGSCQTKTRFNLGHAPQSTIRAPAIGSYCARVVVASPSTISYIS